MTPFGAITGMRGTHSAQHEDATQAPWDFTGRTSQSLQQRRCRAKSGNHRLTEVRGGGQTTKKPQGRLGLCAHRWVVFAMVAGCGHRTRAAMRGTHLKFKVMITVPLEGLLGGREHNVLEDAWGYCKAGSLLPPHPAHSAPRPQRSQVPTLSLWSAPALPWGSQQPPPHPRYTTVLSRLVHSWDAPHTGC